MEMVSAEAILAKGPVDPSDVVFGPCPTWIIEIVLMCCPTMVELQYFLAIILFSKQISVQLRLTGDPN